MTNSLLKTFEYDTLVKGQPAKISCVEIQGQTYEISSGSIRTVRLQEEWYEDVSDPQSVIAALTGNRNIKADIFTFWQRLPDLEPKHKYLLDWYSIAALRIHSFDYWFSKQVKGTTRNMIRKSEKAGVEVRECTFTDDFVHGMTEIFNESPVRQGRRFWHYGKDFHTVKAQFSRNLFREYLLGAFCGEEMVGFVMLANAGRFGVLGQFISKIKHRDKAINNALIAKTVEKCAECQLEYLVYGDWSTTSLADFKRHSGFEEKRLPRYYVPLSLKGKVAIGLGIHHDSRGFLPKRMTEPLKRLRKSWYDWINRSSARMNKRG